ncbi:MAG: 30S ribosomal protein S4 [Lachnospiraceae bacterium]|nr:30S ribosomal protein S4 [Lachnospiraceae bacterium]MDE6685697.1 30S ribosomal protein S4 [Lachnospiraceae bacterium]MDE6743616.1 30S ribosomal protein S4 [Lachnospiraceae bacterium]
MAINRVPVLKKCRALGLDPSYLGVEKYTHTSEWKREVDGQKKNINKKLDRHVNESIRSLRNPNKKVSEYGMQLREKQKAKFIYGVLEKPFRNYYEKADRMKGMTGENLMIMLESRLDSVVFRMGFARTRREARQVVGHKHVLVNGKKVNIPSYLVKAGDVIELTEKAKGLQRFKDIIEVTESRIVPDWMEVDYETKKGTVKELPTREAIDVPVNEMLIVELYSK